MLDRLALLYGCDVADLLAGWGEHGTPRGEAARSVAEAATLAWQAEHLNLPELTRAVADWAHRLPDGQRRAMLLKLSTATSVLPAGGAQSPQRRSATVEPERARRLLDQLLHLLQHRPRATAHR